MALNFADGERLLRLPDGGGELLVSTHLDRDGPVDGRSLPLRAAEGCVIRSALIEARRTPCAHREITGRVRDNRLVVGTSHDRKFSLVYHDADDRTMVNARIVEGVETNSGSKAVLSRCARIVGVTDARQVLRFVNLDTGQRDNLRAVDLANAFFNPNGLTLVVAKGPNSPIFTRELAAAPPDRLRLGRIARADRHERVRRTVMKLPLNPPRAGWAWRLILDPTACAILSLPPVAHAQRFQTTRGRTGCPSRRDLAPVSQRELGGPARSTASPKVLRPRRPSRAPAPPVGQRPVGHPVARGALLDLAKRIVEACRQVHAAHHKGRVPRDLVPRSARNGG